MVNSLRARGRVPPHSESHRLGFRVSGIMVGGLRLALYMDPTATKTLFAAILALPFLCRRDSWSSSRVFSAWRGRLPRTDLGATTMCAVDTIAGDSSSKKFAPSCGTTYPAKLPLLAK